MKPTDPLYAQQWHFGLMGDIETIWNDYTGTGVTVVVYDEGVDYTHPDLAANFDTSTFFTYNGVVYDPMPIDDQSGHGTSCAGLIGAVANNGLGGTGVAPGVTLNAVNFLDVIQFQPQDVYDAAMLYAANFDIMSNSWGSGGSFTKSQNLANANSSASHDISLWAQVEATGRDGLGTVIVKASGNETNNANGDGVNASRFSITVSATDNHGNATSYTNYGADILVAAPASAVTTDLQGDAGYNTSTDSDPVPVDYTSTFNGTSAATPTVAGVVALMLDANPNLGWRDVENILALSASHTGSSLGGTPTRFEQGTWMTMGGTLWNGGGTEFNQSYGYGMVDAFAAVRYAEAWAVIYPTNPMVSANEAKATYDHSGPAIHIPDSDGKNGTGQVGMSITSTSNISIESIAVTVNMTHPNGKDMNLWLKAPDGTMIPIFAGDGNNGTWDSATSWTFEVDCLRGYNSAGTWTVVAEDTATGNVGTLNDVQITFYGSPDSTSDVYNFTQDFQMMIADDPTRSQLNDTNGGIDTLNFAAIQVNMTANMAAGGTILFGSAKVATFVGKTDVFEKFYSGDGADTISGNTLSNSIWGERGNDSLHGMNGKDMLDGGDGNDTLIGDNANDSLYGGDGNDRLIGSLGNDALYGQGGADIFQFGLSTGLDTIYGWQNDTDTLSIDDALWGGGKTVQQVLNSFAHVTGGNTVLDFGDVKITLVGLTNINSLVDDIILT